ncbi:hypothetical protein D3C71_2248340 [compost metagenome]
MKNATVASSNEARKANTAPAATPGAILGKTTSTKACNLLAPQFRAANSSAGSNRCSAAVTVIIT